MQYNSPSSMYHASFNKVSVSEFCSGNRDKIGSSPEVYRKISSEGKQSEVPSIDLVTSLTYYDSTSQVIIKRFQDIFNGFRHFFFGDPFYRGWSKVVSQPGSSFNTFLRCNGYYNITKEVQAV